MRFRNHFSRRAIASCLLLLGCAQCSNQRQARLERSLTPTATVALPPHGPPPKVDWELALSKQTEIEQAAEEAKVWRAHGNRSPSEIDARNRWIVARFPASRLAAKTYADSVWDLIGQKQYEPAVHAAVELVAKYASFSKEHDAPLKAIEKMLAQEDIAGDQRVALLKEVAPAFKDRSAQALRMFSRLHKVPLSLTQRFELAKGLAEACGQPLCASFWWDSLRAAHSELGEPRFAQEARELSTRFAVSPSGAAADLTALELAAKAGDNAASSSLRDKTANKQRAQEQLTIVSNKVTALLAQGDSQAAARALDELMNHVPAEATQETWLALVSALTNAPAEIALPLFQVLVERAPPGEALEQAGPALQHMTTTLPALKLLVKLLPRLGQDRDRDFAAADFAIRMLDQSKADAHALFEAYRGAAALAARFSADDRRVQYLTGMGKAGWDLEPREAREALREAATFYPRLPQAAEAGWLLAALEGYINVSQEALPRARLAGDEWPEPPLTELDAPKAARATTTRSARGITLATQDPKLDLLRGAAARASSGASSARLALDGAADTAWEPEALPASLLVPLKQATSVASVRVATEDPAYFSVSLLDCAGNTVGRAARDWGFWDAYRRESYWPNTDSTLELLPQSAACFVRLELLGSSTSRVRVQSLEAHASAVQAQGTHLAEPVAVGDARSLRVRFAVEEPERTQTYDAAGEWAATYPVVRWNGFFTHEATPRLKPEFGVLGLSFSGTNVSLHTQGAGDLTWFLDGGTRTTTPMPSADGERQLANGLAPGLHVLGLSGASRAENGVASTSQLLGATVKAVSRARIAVRFSSDKQHWSEWSAPIAASGDVVSMPSEAGGKKPRFAQAGAFFDARELRGSESATLRELNIDVLAQAEPASAPAAWPRSQTINDDLPTIAGLLARRALVVAYAKSGSTAEYEAARRLAEKAQVYLVSDDIGLNLYPGPVLAVGTPLRNRYARQLLASQGLWNAPEFFAKKDGLLSVARDSTGTPWFYAATGDTPSAVVRAVERLSAALPEAKPDTELRVFAANPLDELYPWQLHADAPAVKAMDLRLAVNDRRSAVLGISAPHDVAKLSVSATVPISDNGDKLAPLTIRPVGYYEWVPFFGDLRLPNLLLDSTSLPLQANSARSIWFTATTRNDSKPGVYHSEITLDADGRSQRVPLTIRVESVTLPLQSKTASFSFEYPPYWYHSQSAQYLQVLRQIAADEAAHGVTHVGPRFTTSWQIGEHLLPQQFARQAINTAPESLSWNSAPASIKTTPPDQAVFLRFAKPLTSARVLLAIRAKAASPVNVAVRQGSRWLTLPSQTTRNEKLATGLFFAVNTKFDELRVSVGGGAPWDLERMAAFADKPIHFDFAELDRDMSVYEDEYRKLGFSPKFVLQNTVLLRAAAMDLTGIASDVDSGVLPLFAADLHDHLAKTNRLERTLLKIDDEPKDIELWLARARPFHDAGLRTMTTHNGTLPKLADASGVMAPWCPVYSNSALDDFFQRRKEKGEQVWWYAYGPPNMRLTGRPAENLALSWLTAKYGFDGEMTYAALHTLDTSMPVPFRYDNGQAHRVVVLPNDKLLDTPRRELEGEGLSDLKLIEYVRAVIAKSPPKVKAALGDALERTLNDVIKSPLDYSTDGAPWLRARERLYTLALDATLGRAPDPLR